MKRMRIGIIGYGRFGKLVSHYFGKDHDIWVCSKTTTPQQLRKKGMTPASFPEICSCDLIIPCVPINQFESTIKHLKRYVTPSSVVMDVCSVKTIPCRIMKKHLTHCQLLATHPLFGPDSAKHSLKGKKIVCHPLRLNKSTYQKLTSYFKHKGLQVITQTPQEHDKAIAHSLFLTHYIGRLLLHLKAKDQDIDTEGYTRLLHILETVEHDTWQLFKDMYEYNPYAQKILKQLHTAMNVLSTKLG